MGAKEEVLSAWSGQIAKVKAPEFDFPGLRSSS